MISLVIIPSKLPALIKGTSTNQTASMRICHLLVTFYKCNNTFSLRGSFFKLLVTWPYCGASGYQPRQSSTERCNYKGMSGLFFGSLF